MQANNTAILAQKAGRLVRNYSLRWLAALFTLPFFGVVAAFGVAPQTQTETIPLQSLVEDIALPGSAELLRTPDEFWSEERIQRGDTVASLLARLNVDDPEAINYLRNGTEVKSLYQLKPGKTVQAKIAAGGGLLALRYVTGDDRLLTVERTGAGFAVDEQPLPMERRVLMKSGEIKSSLFAATDDAGLPDSVATQLADIFSGEIDFHRDLRRGDKFTVVFEGYSRDGETVKTGRLLAAEFINQGRSHKALYFEDSAGRGGYYTPDGKSLRKAFLRSPLEFSRITSGFSASRLHPVLQTWRAHKGVDYGAPVGTRVKATGDGTVTFIGRQGGYGNVVILQHQGRYSTVYGHLSGYAGGLQRGQRVSQGDVIGFVGMTGLATGPHLHYEFRINGEQRDPLRVAMPDGPAITAQLKPEFEQSIQPFTQRLALLRDTNLARLD